MTAILLSDVKMACDRITDKDNNELKPVDPKTWRETFKYLCKIKNYEYPKQLTRTVEVDASMSALLTTYFYCNRKKIAVKPRNRRLGLEELQQLYVAYKNHICLLINAIGNDVNIEEIAEPKEPTIKGSELANKIIAATPFTLQTLYNWGRQNPDLPEFSANRDYTEEECQQWLAFAEAKALKRSKNQYRGTVTPELTKQVFTSEDARKICSLALSLDLKTFNYTLDQVSWIAASDWHNARRKLDIPNKDISWEGLCLLLAMFVFICKCKQDKEDKKLIRRLFKEESLMRGLIESSRNKEVQDTLASAIDFATVKDVSLSKEFF